MSAAATLADHLTRLADAAERGPADQVPTLLSSGLAACVAGAAPTSSWADLAQRLTVWRDVWPRLGKDPQFRAAVAREARRWAALV